jgi:integrase
MRFQLAFVGGSPTQLLTVGDLLCAYERRKLHQLRRGAATYRHLKTVLQPVAGKDVTLLTRRELGMLIDDLADRAPIQANRTLAYMKAFFGWAVGRGYMDTSPAAPLAKPVREIARERAPDIVELAEIWVAAESLGYPFGDAVRLLMLTASRRDEVSAMRVDELDLGACGTLCWTIPAARSKTGRSIKLALPNLARSIVESALAARPAGSQWVFSTNGSRPISGWSKAKARLDQTIVRHRLLENVEPAYLTPWRLHDLRRSFATLACDALNIDPAVADRCLNHVGASTRSTISRVYGRSEFFEQRKDALSRWSELIQAAVYRGRLVPA